MGFLAQPFGVVMKFLYEYLAFGNYGVAIILFTLFVRVLLFPLTLKQQKSLVLTQSLQPELEALKRSCGDDREMLMQEQQKLYTKYNINPMSGCLPMLIQFPILIVVYNIIRQPLTYIAEFSGDVIAKLGEIAGITGNNLAEHAISRFFLDSANLTPEITAQLSELGIKSGDFVNMTFLKIFDLGISPWQFFSGGANGKLAWEYAPLLLIPIITLVTQYFLQWMTSPRRKKDKGAEDPSMRSMNLMMKVMPLMTFFIAFTTPAGLGFYWAIGNVLSVGQTALINKVFVKKKEG